MGAKITNLRLTFYDTDGRGSPLTVHSEVDYFLGRKTHYLPEEFASAGIVRLGHHFPKESQKTPTKDLQSSTNIRKEDLAHDETSGPTYNGR